MRAHTYIYNYSIIRPRWHRGKKSIHAPLSFWETNTFKSMFQKTFTPHVDPFVCICVYELVRALDLSSKTIMTYDKGVRVGNFGSFLWNSSPLICVNLILFVSLLKKNVKVFLYKCCLLLLSTYWCKITSCSVRATVMVQTDLLYSVSDSGF